MELNLIKLSSVMRKSRSLKTASVCLLLIVLANVNMFALDYLQTRSINVELKNASLVEVLSCMRKQSSVDFIYKQEDIDNIDNLTINAVDASIGEILDECLENSKLKYQLHDDAIILMLRNDNAQQEKIIITGIIYDQKKQPIPGANIIIENYNTGTISDTEGKFRIQVPEKHGFLLCSFIGFKKKRVEFNGTEPLIIRMVEETEGLDEVQIIAYGTTTRRKMTGSVATIKAEEIQNVPSPSLENLLQGKVAGMDVSNISGSPGSGGTSITIRGYNSITSGLDRASRFSDPLWVVDGVPILNFNSPVTGTNMLADINPEMIESIEVLKDASSAALYGSRAANGVILVTTKSGKNAQKAKISVNVSQSYSYMPKLPTITIGKGERDYRIKAIKEGNKKAYYDYDTNDWIYTESLKDSYLNRYKNHLFNGWWSPNPHTDTPNSHENALSDSLNTFYNNQTNHYKEYFQKAKVTNANLQVYGGNKKITYGLGLGYYSETGILKGTGFNRLNLSCNLKVKPVEKITFDFRFAGSFNERNRRSGNQSKGFNSAPTIETIPGDPHKLSSLLPGQGSAVHEQIINALNGVDEKNRNIGLRNNMKLTYDIFKNMTISSSLATEFSFARRNTFVPSTMSWDDKSQSRGSVGPNIMLLNENLITYKNSLNDLHNFNFIGGFTYQYDQYEMYSGIGENSPSDDIKYVTDLFPKYELIEGTYSTEVRDYQRYESDMNEKAMMSGLARLEYDYLSKYLLSMSIRSDGVSVFGENKKWATFPAFAIGWAFSEEPFMENFSRFISFAKIRSSWGKSGKQFHKPYLAYGILNAGQTIAGNPTIVPEWRDGLYNKNLGWEETAQFDVGLELDLFNYKLNITSDYYLRNTTDLLYPVTIPGSLYNSYLTQWRNAASISNSGIELLLKWKAVEKTDWSLSLNFNVAKNWNRFDDSHNGEDLDPTAMIIGKPLNGIYGFKTDGFIDNKDELSFITSPTGQTKYLNKTYEAEYYYIGDRKMVDVNGDNKIDINDEVFLGSALPEVIGGFNVALTYKQFDLTANFAYQLKRHIINMQRTNSIRTTGSKNDIFKPLLVDMKDITFWQKPGDENVDFEKLGIAYGGRYAKNIDENVENVSWLKLKSIVLGYNLSTNWCKKIGIEGARAFISGSNLFTLTNYSGIDPETVDIRNGIDDGTNYPLARKFTLGLTLKF